MERIDDKHAFEIDKGLFWLGFADYEAGFSNNPYLLLDEDEAVLIDPGPGHPIFREIILQKIQELISPEIIKYIIVQHQDPDLCALIPLIENYLNTELVIITTPRTAGRPVAPMRVTGIRPASSALRQNPNGMTNASSVVPGVPK